MTTRYAELVDDDLAIAITGGAANITLTNPHRDVVATVGLSSSSSTALSVESWNSLDEFGTPVHASRLVH